jgi:hypothetical protein
MYLELKNNELIIKTTVLKKEFGKGFVKYINIIKLPERIFYN